MRVSDTKSVPDTKPGTDTNYSHSQARNDIEALADGVLPTNRQAQLQTHLAACPECRAHQEEFLALEISLSEMFQASVPKVEFDPAENQPFIAHVKTTATARRPRLQVPRWMHIPEWMHSLAWGSAVALIMLGMAWVLANTRLENRPPIEPPPSLSLSLSFPPGSRFTLPGDGTRAYQVAFSPDGSLIASAYESGQVILWQTATQETYLTLDADTQGVSSLTFSPNGLLFTLGKENGTLKVWQPSNGQLIQTLTGIPGNPLAVGISPTGEVQFTRLPNELILNPHPGVNIPWATRRGADRLPIVLPALAGEVVTASISPDGKILATGSTGGMISFWQIAVQDGYLQGNLLFRLEGHTGSITSLAFHPDGQWLVSASEDGTVRVWRVTDGGYMYTLLQEESAVRSLAFSPNGASLAAALADGMLYLWVGEEE